MPIGKYLVSVYPTISLCKVTRVILECEKSPQSQTLSVLHLGTRLYSKGGRQVALIPPYDPNDRGYIVLMFRSIVRVL